MKQSIRACMVTSEADGAYLEEAVMLHLRATSYEICLRDDVVEN
jgi:hypothetical protein